MWEERERQVKEEVERKGGTEGGREVGLTRRTRDGGGRIRRSRGERGRGGMEGRM